MSGHTLDFAAVDDLVAALRGAGLRADVDPALLNPPCVWVNVTGIDLNILDGLTINTEVVAIVPDKNHKRAMQELAELFNLVTDVVDPTGPTLARGTVLPDNPTPLPSLVVPFDLLVT